MWTSIKKFLAKLIAWIRRKRPAVGFAWFVNGVQEEDMALLLTNTQKVTLSVQPVDAKGFPAAVHSVPVWSQTDPTVGTLVPAADGFSAEFLANTTGLTQVSVSADADSGPTVRTITASLDINVEAGSAVSLLILPGTPTEQ